MNRFGGVDGGSSEQRLYDFLHNELPRQTQSESVGHGIRGYLAIAHSVLTVCLNGALKTHIMFNSNLNTRQVHFYLESLVKKGLLEIGRSPPSVKVEYTTTVKGKEFIGRYSALVKLLSEQVPMERELYA